MKKVAVIFILASLLVQSFSTLIILVNYQINKDYITQNFCENKSKPMMHCNGQCHLKKQLQKQEKNESTPVNPVKEKNVIQLFSQSQIFNFSDIETGSTIYSSYLLKEIKSSAPSVFHPPTC